MSIIYGTSGSDSLLGTEGKDTIIGYAGHDNLSGEGGNDRLYGNQGNDGLTGGAGNDKLSGGSGDDYLMGGEGQDTYLFGRGFDQDIIYNYDYQTNSANGDTVLLGKNIATSDVTVRREWDDLLISINNTDDTLRIQGYFYSDALTSNAVENIQFDDGTVWHSDTIKEMVQTSTPQNDILFGYSENDALSGGEGNDTLIGYDGNDKLHGDNGNDWLDGGTGNDRLYGDNGSDSLYGAEGNDRLYGGRGNDSLDGGFGNDTLNGGSGNDWLAGGQGADTYVFGKGSGQDTIYNYDYYSSSTAGDTIALGSGISTEEVSITREWDDLLISINNSEDTLRVQSYFTNDAQTNHAVEKLQFADGTVWDVATIKDKVLMPTPQDDILHGYSGNDTLNGEEGNDQLYGNAGNDKLNGGKGSDFLDGGEGNDRLRGNEGHDTLYGYNGNDALFGNQGNDWLVGGEGNDTLNGGAGNDYLMGEAGQDQYLFGQHAGQDTISNYNYLDDTSANGDSIVLGNTVTTENIVLAREWDDLVLNLGNGDDTLRVGNYFYNEGQSSYTVENIQFADGTTWHYSDVLNGIPSGEIPEVPPEEPPVEAFVSTAELSQQTDTLVSTLASLPSPSIGEISMPNNYQSSMSPVISVL